MRLALALVSPFALLACATTDSSTLATIQIQPRFMAKVEANPSKSTTYVSAILGQPGSMSNVRLAAGDVLTAKTDKDAQLGFVYNDVLQVYSFTLDWPPDDSSGLQDALAAKLGLQLESKKTTVDTVIVDRAEKPSGNGA